MRILAAKLRTVLCRKTPINPQSRNFSSSYKAPDERTIEEEAERKIGWFLKLLFAGTATVVAYQFFPYMGDNLLELSISLLHVKDPLFKRMGASRLARFAADDERRMKIVEMGGTQELLNMLEAAKDESTRKEALRALAAISMSDNALESLHQSGAIKIIKSAPAAVVLHYALSIYDIVSMCIYYYQMLFFMLGERTWKVMVLLIICSIKFY